MKIYFATDHAGFALKERAIAFVRDELGYEVEDCGAYELNQDDDYPDFISKAARAVSENPTERKAVIFGGSGQGEAIVANRFPFVRAAVWYGGPEEILTLSREHNDANVLSIGARFIDEDKLLTGIEKWLHTDFSSEERHIRRLNKIDETFHIG